MKMTATEVYNKLLNDDKILTQQGRITFKFSDVDIIVKQRDVVGNIMQEWLEGWLRHNGVEYAPNENTQMPPDVFLDPQDKKHNLMEVKAFNGNQIIEDVEQSINTNHPYTHYHLAIPNADCQLTMSGNYRLTVYDDNAENEEEGKMFTACWMITEPQPLVKLKLEATSTTDIDIQKTHQQLKMELDHIFPCF